MLDLLTQHRVHELALLGKVLFLLLLLEVASFQGSGQPEIAYFDDGPLVDEDVGRLEVAVDDVQAVEVLEPAQDLVGDELHVVDLQEYLLGLEHAVEVGLAALGDQVERGEVLRVQRRYHLDELDDVVVVELLQDHDLSQDPPGVHGVVEHVRYFLDGDLCILGCTS